MSEPFWQEIATFVMLAIAVSYVIRRIWPSSSTTKAGGCGSCGSCGSSSKGACAPAEVVTIGPMYPRKTV